MPTHDLVCTQCGEIERDVYVPLGRLTGAGQTSMSCAICLGTLAVYLGNWTEIGIPNNGRDVNDRLDKDNFLRKANVADDALCRIEVGLQDKHGDKQLRTFTPEQQREFQERILVEGDTHKLRAAVLETREKNLKEKVK